MVNAALELLKQNRAVAEFVATIPRARFVSCEYTKVGKVQGRGEDKRRRGNARVLLSVICGFSYRRLCERSLDALWAVDPSDVLCDVVDSQSAKLGWEELRESLERSIAGENESTTDEAFAPLIVDGEVIPGARVHVESGTVYLQALRVHEKTVINAEPLRPANSSPKTIAKRRLRKRLPIGRYISIRLSPGQEPRFSFTSEV